MIWQELKELNNEKNSFKIVVRTSDDFLFLVSNAARREVDLLHIQVFLVGINNFLLTVLIF